MKIPKIVFSKWIRWPDRRKIRNSNQPGVYLIAIFKNLPPKKANLLDKEIIYVGETCGNTPRGRKLTKRWCDFNRSALTGKKGHSGGQRCRGICRTQFSNMYVTAFPVPISEMKEQMVRNSFIRYVERRIIWGYTYKYNRLPYCNTK